MSEEVEKKRGRRSMQEATDDRRVLMTFQVDVSLRDAAMQKANETSINLSQFLRQCVHEFVNSDEISKATENLQRSIVGSTLNEVNTSNN
jgi:hypothetical protein